jgi:hypothetical protein
MKDDAPNEAIMKMKPNSGTRVQSSLRMALLLSIIRGLDDGVADVLVVARNRDCVLFVWVAHD